MGDACHGPHRPEPGPSTASATSDICWVMSDQVRRASPSSTRDRAHHHAQLRQCRANCGSGAPPVTRRRRPTRPRHRGRRGLDAVAAVFTENTPANTTFSSIVTPAAEDLHHSAAIGTSGTISCNTSTGIFSHGTSGTFTVVVTVAAGTFNGTQIVDIANITSSTTDPILPNNRHRHHHRRHRRDCPSSPLPTPFLPHRRCRLERYTHGRCHQPRTLPRPRPVLARTSTGTPFVSITGPGGWGCYPPVGVTVECVGLAPLGSIPPPLSCLSSTFPSPPRPVQ